MFSAVVGHSEEGDAAAAVEEIVQQCRGRLAGSAPKAGLLFAAIDFDPRPCCATSRGRTPESR
jgi:hypothetical protein